MLLLFTSHALFPRARPFTSKFFHMSYPLPEANAYTRGTDDAYLVLFWIVLFTGLRAAVMDYVLKPFARWGGIHSTKGLIRFAEQGWLVVYDSAFWSLGMVSRTRFLRL
jgi:very-long-chain ceramide synthase